MCVLCIFGFFLPPLSRCTSAGASVANACQTGHSRICKRYCLAGKQRFGEHMSHRGSFGLCVRAFLFRSWGICISIPWRQWCDLQQIYLFRYTPLPQYTWHIYQACSGGTSGTTELGLVMASQLSATSAFVRWTGCKDLVWGISEVKGQCLVDLRTGAL